MAEFFQALGLPGLFTLSFLAATIIPLGSEWLLVTLILQDQQLWPVVLTATAGNYLGACTTFLMGSWGSGYLSKKIIRISPKQQQQANLFYQKYGKWSLLLSWLPVLGDPLCLIAGIQRLNFKFFSFLVIAGKFMRYAGIAIITSATLQ